MVLDAKAMEWAAANGIDTAKLKAAKIPIYGKWYFPEIPAGVPLVNLKTGEVASFGSGLRAGEILFVARADLRRAKLGPYAEGAVAEPEAAPREQAATVGPSPAPTVPLVGRLATYDDPLPPGEDIHLPGPSIFPLVLGLGLALAMVGAVAGPLEVRALVVLLGLVYLAAGGFGWAAENRRDRQAQANTVPGHGSTE